MTDDTIAAPYDMPVDRLVDTDTAAMMLGVRPNTLAKARVYGGPHAIVHVRLGRRIRYSTAAIRRHIADNQALRTSDPRRA